jgi:hypothetical protein
MRAAVNAQVNIVSTHFYSTCDQTDTDATLMNTVPGFAANVSYFYKELKTRPDLADVPVWVTENNVNADYAASNGMSTCNPNQVFVDDHRGTSAFFAAWRPYVFSQLGKVGNQALYHWSYDADQQYGEVDGNGNTYLSYWVDQTLTNAVSLDGELRRDRRFWSYRRQIQRRWRRWRPRMRMGRWW